jgi:hypothetical protein
MPPRLLSVGILIYWSAATWLLISRDLLPEFTLAQPPDLRTITRAEAGSVPARWEVQVIDDPSSPETRRKVGEAITGAVRRGDGKIMMTNRAWFDSHGLLKGTAFADKTNIRLVVDSTYMVDASGNLQSLQINVTTPSEPTPLFKVDGVVRNRALEITMFGLLPMLNVTRSIPYEPRGVIQNTLGPLDRPPGLQVGMRWDVRVVNPLTSKADTVRVEVTRKRVIQWNRNPVTTLEVVQHLSPLTARTWVRPDGVVLRQEVPLPFVKLVLDRIPDQGNNSSRGSTR